LQQHDSPLLAEAQRQFLICSACRYCESYCATFPAIEARTEYTAHDAAYIANVCHDCRACFQACMYTAPHEFAMDIPKLLADVRLETYEQRALPAPARRAIGNASGIATFGIAVAVAVLLFVAIRVTGHRPTADFIGDAPGSFYRIVPFLWMLVPALVLSIWGFVVLYASGRKLVRDVAPEARATLADVIGAWKDGLNLTYMRGGGEGCYYPAITAPSNARRVLHVTLVAGVALAFLATVAAAFMQDVLERLPPYPLLSVPVVSGTLGGVCIVIGGVGLLVLKAQRTAKNLDNRGMLKLDLIFLWTLIAVAVTGLLLLAFRGTPYLAPLLVLHLATVATLFITAPYGKFIHVPLRLAALLIFRMEEARDGGK
jgi:citrate/tricarballylate utilization protein